jgi:polyisoprenoid-binding protein YceI
MHNDTTTTAPLPLQPGHWVLDPSHSAITFTVRHLGISKVRGRFDRFDAELIVGATVADCAVSATIAVGSIDTGIADRDAHLLAADMLDVERRPTMTFRSTRVHGRDDDWSLDGELTIGDVTRPITLDVGFGGLRQFVADNRRHAGFEATGQIRRSDFGLGFGAAMDAVVGDVVKLQLDVQFVEPV